MSPVSEFQEGKKIFEEKGSKRSRTGYVTTTISMLHGDRSLGKDESLLH